MRKEFPVIFQIPSDIQKIADKIISSGNEIYIVGGAVRDFLQNKIPHDFDLVTNLSPDESKNILKDFHVSDEQGQKFAVLRIYTKENPLGYELATFRKDISGGRDTKSFGEKVIIGKNITIEDDVLRRDLTFNALFYDLNKKCIVDLVGGIEDLKNKIVRMVGKPEDRFNEDRLRILRVLRFASRSEFNIHIDTKNAIKTDNKLNGISSIDDVSQERIVDEFMKMWNHTVSANSIKIFIDYLNLITEFNLWEQMFKNSKVFENFEHLNGLDFSAILANIFRPEQDLINKMLYDWKFPNDVSNQVLFLHSFEEKYINDSNIFKIVINFHRANLTTFTLKNFSIMRNLNQERIDKIIKYIQRGFTIKGDDLLLEGFKGKDLGIEKEKRELEIFKSI